MTRRKCWMSTTGIARCCVCFSRHALSHFKKVYRLLCLCGTAACSLNTGRLCLEHVVSLSCEVNSPVAWSKAGARDVQSAKIPLRALVYGPQSNTFSGDIQASTKIGPKAYELGEDGLYLQDPVQLEGEEGTKLSGHMVCGFCFYSSSALHGLHCASHGP